MWLGSVMFLVGVCLCVWVVFVWFVVECLGDFVFVFAGFCVVEVLFFFWVGSLSIGGSLIGVYLGGLCC